MHHEVKLRGNKIDSNHYKDLPSAFIDDFLNEAQLEFKEICYSGRNGKRYQLGFEMTQQRIDLLADIVVFDESVTFDSIGNDIFKIVLSDLEHKYDHFVRGYVVTNCEVTIPITIETHNDLNEVLKDENRKPSAMWRRCIGAFGNNDSTNLFIYTGGDFTIEEVYITYIKAPRKVFFGGYDSLEYLYGDEDAYASGDSPVDSEFLNQTACSLIVDIAVQLINRSLENPNSLQLVEDKITRII